MTAFRSTSFPVILRAALALALAFVVTGCGGSDEGEEYEAGLKRVQAQLEEASDASQAAAGDVEDEQRRAALAEAQEAMERAADTAESLDPPADVRDAHDDLTTALRDYAELFGKIASTPAEDPSVSELYGEAGKIVERLETANGEIREAGYAVGGNGDGE